MIPVLDGFEKSSELYNRYVTALKESGFSGDIHTDYASRLSMAVDNSIYYVLPQVVVYPKNFTDMEWIFKLSQRPEFSEIKFSSRGAGTGTNGQSLSGGVIVDSSRHLNRIVEINYQDKYVVVEPGVVLDQLNDALAESEYFFAPNLSPSNRATLGGMASTDACGKGSRIYGRTSQHILKLKCLRVNGHALETSEIDATTFAAYLDDPIHGDIYRSVQSEVIGNYPLIEATFPQLSRFMTGYNLAKAYNPETKSVNLSYLISGSEGTLVQITELTLKLTKKPKKKVLFAISYSSFENALRDAKELLAFDPAAIETIDDNIIALAKHDEIYQSIRHMIESDIQDEVAAINLVEFVADDAQHLIEKQQDFARHLVEQSRSYYCALASEEISALWELRKKGVGLLGAMKGDRKPIPFMEDTAVPPENLADYIVELRALLDSYGLKYGMFGHVDVGCLHMRPALDMNNSDDSQLVVKLTKQVNDLVRKYGGVYWSEHGKGFRSEYVKDYFGDQLYDALRNIKTTFDPLDQLNPGKIVTAKNTTTELVKVDGPFRGYQDATIPSEVRAQFSGAFNCNGNAQCLNYNLDAVMCPSAKATRNWVHSPKGRTALLRSWLKQLTDKRYSLSSKSTKRGIHRRNKHSEDFSHQVYDSLDNCLGCKACATACPIKVNIPHMKADFLQHYHSRYRRPLRDYVIHHGEAMAHWLHRSALTRYFAGNKLTGALTEKLFGLVDMPRFSEDTLDTYLKKHGNAKISLVRLANITDRSKVVVIVQDAFTSYYDAKSVIATHRLLSHLGYQVYVLPFLKNGKPAHVKGFVEDFKRIATKATEYYNAVAALDIPMIGVDPAMTLVYRDEYVQSLGDQVRFKVQLLQEWLVSEIKADKIPAITLSYKDVSYQLLPHCSERSLAAVSLIHWQKVFKHFGLNLGVKSLGCCGMAGTYGHEKHHLDDSTAIFKHSWDKALDKIAHFEQIPLATGFSCRCQVKRIKQQEIQHPISLLADLADEYTKQTN